jgi:hypothetical protein
MMAITKTRRTEHHKTPPTHTQDHTQYRRSTVKEHDHHWDSQQDFNQLKSLINFKKSILIILSANVTHTRQHTCNTCEAFPLWCWSPSDDGPSLAETCNGLILLLKTLLPLMEFNPNFTYEMAFRSLDPSACSAVFLKMPPLKLYVER